MRIRSGSLFPGRLRGFDDAHDVALLEDQQVFAIDFDLRAGPFAEEHRVAGPDVERDELAGVVACARPDGDDLALLWFFLGGVGDDDAALRGDIAFGAANDDAIVKWP